MLRAIRFSTQLGFAIEKNTWQAICDNAKSIIKISGERIAMELEGILISPRRAAGVSLLLKSGLADAIFPALAGKSAVSVLGKLPKNSDFVLAMVGLFADCTTEFALEKCKILKLSKNQIKNIKFLLANRGKLLNDKMSLAELKMILAEPYFEDLYELQKAIQKAGKKSTTALLNLRKRIKSLGDIELKPKPLLNGHDLMKLGAVPGPALGQLARELYVTQLEGVVQTPKQAKLWTLKWLQKHQLNEK
jgi:poly(A) polymerase